MPIEDTPLAQPVVALATKCTGEDTGEPVEGEETDTAENAGIAASTRQHTRVFICTPNFVIDPVLGARGTSVGLNQGNPQKKESCNNFRCASTNVQATANEYLVSHC